MWFILIADPQSCCCTADPVAFRDSRILSSCRVRRWSSLQLDTRIHLIDRSLTSLHSTGHYITFRIDVHNVLTAQGHRAFLSSCTGTQCSQFIARSYSVLSVIICYYDISFQCPDFSPSCPGWKWKVHRVHPATTNTPLTLTQLVLRVTFH